MAGMDFSPEQMQQFMDFMNKSNRFSGAAGMAGGLANLFGGGGKNPANSANDYYNKIPGETGQYMNDYINQGKQAGALGQGEYEKGINDPNAVYDKLAGGYKESPGYKYALEQAMRGGNAAAASGGSLGTPANQEDMMNRAGDVASKDFNNYLNSTTGIYNKGLEGNENTTNRGFESSKQMADYMAQIRAMQGQNAYAGQAGQNARRGSAFGDFAKGLGQFGASFIPGGSAVSGGLGWLSNLFGGK